MNSGTWRLDSATPKPLSSEQTDPTEKSTTNDAWLTGAPTEGHFLREFSPAEAPKAGRPGHSEAVAAGDTGGWDGEARKAQRAFQEVTFYNIFSKYKLASICIMETLESIKL